MSCRGERIADVLEAQLRRCEQMLADCDKTMEENDSWTEHDLREVLSLTKASTQLASVLGRLEAKFPSQSGRAQPEKRESSGSNPQ